MFFTVTGINLMILFSVMLQEERKEDRSIFTVSVIVQIETTSFLKDTSVSVLPFCGAFYVQIAFHFIKHFCCLIFFNILLQFGNSLSRTDLPL